MSEEARAGSGMRSTVAASSTMLGPGLLLAAIAALIALDASGSGTTLRHLYLAPTLWGAFTAGAAGGGVIGALAGLLYAPVALPAVERAGLTGQTVDGLMFLAIPIACGCIVGRLVDQARGRRARLQTVLEMQRSLARAGPLDQRLGEVAERVRASLNVDRVGLVVGSESGEPLVAGAPSPVSLDGAAAAAVTLRSGRVITVSDLSADLRFTRVGACGPAPVRGVSLPLDAGAGLVGALAIEKVGDLPAATRAAAQELAMHLALAVDNVRLTLRQRHFAEELEAKVGAATARLRELDQAKTEFLSVVAHELRTPLTALQGFSELLLSRTLPPERAARFLNHVHAEAGRLGRIVTELLDLSRIEAGRSPRIKREAVDLAEMIGRNVELFATEHPRHCFEWALSPAGPSLRADRDAVDRMLKNLLSNAVKYSPRGGRVVVAAGPAADDPGMLELSVEDDGVGIPPPEITRIFDRYARVPHPETAGVRGLGLGLCLVRALAEAHGGHVEVESLPGKGSRFRLLLPFS